MSQVRHGLRHEARTAKQRTPEVTPATRLLTHNYQRMNQLTFSRTWPAAVGTINHGILQGIEHNITDFLTSCYAWIAQVSCACRCREQPRESNQIQSSAMVSFSLVWPQLYLLSPSLHIGDTCTLALTGGWTLQHMCRWALQNMSG